MSNAFAIWLSGAWAEPPAVAAPVAIGSTLLPYAPIVLRNPPTGRSGNGYPIGADDELFAIVGRPSITSTGIAWWYTTVGIGTSSYKPVAVRLWNRWTQAWTDYTGIMYQPISDDPQGEAGYRLRNFRVEFRKLVVI